MKQREVRHVGSADHAWDFYGCRGSVLKKGKKKLEQLLVQDVRDAGFTVLDHVFYRFGPHGAISLLVLIEESHVAIHGSPENGRLLEITIHTCSVEGKVAAKAASHKKDDLFRRWKARFKPEHIETFPERRRGDKTAAYEREVA